MFRAFSLPPGPKTSWNWRLRAIFSCNEAIAARLGCGAWRRGFDATNGCDACGRSRGNGVGRCARRLGVLGLSGSAGRLGRGPRTCAFRSDEGASRGGAAWCGRADPALQGRNAVGGRAGPRGSDSRSACRACRTRADRGCSAAGADSTIGNAAIVRNGAAAAGECPGITGTGRSGREAARKD